MGLEDLVPYAAYILRNCFTGQLGPFSGQAAFLRRSGSSSGVSTSWLDSQLDKLGFGLPGLGAFLVNLAIRECVNAGAAPKSLLGADDVEATQMPAFVFKWWLTRPSRAYTSARDALLWHWSSEFGKGSIIKQLRSADKEKRRRDMQWKLIRL